MWNCILEFLKHHLSGFKLSSYRVILSTITYLLRCNDRYFIGSYLLHKTNIADLRHHLNVSKKNVVEKVFPHFKYEVGL